MEKKRIVILGAGISGLATAYFLSKYPQYEITIIDKKSKPGGWIDTDTSSGFLFENGPRTFRTSFCPHILQLAEELGLKEECIYSDERAKGKYLWIDGKLRSMPIVTLGFIKGFINEWRIPPKYEDETMWEFACRRFNAEVAQLLFDPWAIGIHAGDVHQLSARACLKNFKEWEDKYGNLTKGYFKSSKKREPFLFTFKSGMQSLIEALVKNLSAEICLDEEVKNLEFHSDNVKIETTKKRNEADNLVAAMPVHVFGKWLAPELLSIRSNGTTVVNLAYRKDVLKKKGFGYLVSSKEKDEVLGVVFNSNIFPQQSMHKEETRLTVKLRRSNLLEQEAISISLTALKKHLNIDRSPDFASVVRVENAFPQFEVGHLDRMVAFEERMEREYPRLRVAGNFLYGVGVNDCIARARSVSTSFLSAVAS